MDGGLLHELCTVFWARKSGFPCASWQYQLQGGTTVFMRLRTSKSRRTFSLSGSRAIQNTSNKHIQYIHTQHNTPMVDMKSMSPVKYIPAHVSNVSNRNHNVNAVMWILMFSRCRHTKWDSPAMSQGIIMGF